MKKALVLVATGAVAALGLTAVAGARNTDTQLTGAGSSLVAPLVSQWVRPVGHAFGYSLQYASIGSGGGIAAISSRTVDFGASDAPLTPDQAASCHGCVQIPWALSATTLSYNVPGTPNDLHLTGPVIAGIYLGRITNWSSPQIQRLNPRVKLPDLKITPVYRADGSGDTYAFTDYLSSVSPAWKSKVGNATAVQFPAGVGGKGNAGVAGVVTNTKGAIGYISVAYTLSNHLRVAAIRNASGVYATPGIRGIAAAAATVKSVPASGEMHIVDPPKGNRLAYPISTFTYVILPRRSPKAAELRKFVFWALTQGQGRQYTAKLVFAPLPKVVLVAAEKSLKTMTL
ncbi:MAG TPA: phosphate ABC transporter substrate-binding protein PstS [Gaiellaceae bacterium]|jgi:phosphate transport system substrate-binding protein